MKKSFYLILLLAFSFSTIFAQKSVNSYKYVLVPRQYEFLKSPDKHQLNSLTKFLFDKAGFTTLFTDEVYPQELAANRCLALRVSVDDNSGLFNTKLKINLLDCHNIVVYATKEGRSKEKDYKKAFHEAIRKAFEEIYDLNYSYDGSLNNDQREIIVKDGAIQIVENEVKLTDELIELIGQSEAVEEDIKSVEDTEVKKIKEKEINQVGEIVATGVVLKEGISVVEKEAIKVESKIIVPAVVVVAKKIEKEETPPVIDEKKEIEKKQNELNSSPDAVKTDSLEGMFIMGNWGTCTISKKENVFSVVGGDENFEFATIYSTSNPAIYIIKWAAYKQPQLLEIDNNGNLKVDTENGVKIYKRTN